MLPGSESIKGHIYIYDISTFFFLQFFHSFFLSFCLCETKYQRGVKNIKMEYLDEVLHDHSFNIQLKSQQKECLAHLLNGTNVFAMLPTGFGKSLIYTLFPLIQKKV